MGLVGRPTIGQVPLLIFTYLGVSLFISGFIMTVLAYAPPDTYLMVMIQEMKAMAFIGPIVVIIGLIMIVIALFYCITSSRRAYDDDDDDDD
ncbi:UNVERIFIED_CONTAM: hypothetical protein RMT77_003670 [Armadillidium vulgare]